RTRIRARTRARLVSRKLSKSRSKSTSPKPACRVAKPGQDHLIRIPKLNRATLSPLAANPHPRPLSQRARGECVELFGALSSWERGEGLISLHRACEGGSCAVRDVCFIPA